MLDLIVFYLLALILCPGVDVINKFKATNKGHKDGSWGLKRNLSIIYSRLSAKTSHVTWCIQSKSAVFMPLLQWSIF